MARLVVFDMEMGGLDPCRHSVLSLGAVIWQDRQIIDSFEVFVREMEIVTEPAAMAVNKIDIQWLQEHGCQPSDAVHQFHDFLARHFGPLPGREKIILAGHNLHADIGFLGRLYGAAGLSHEPYFSHRVLDTASLLRFLYLAGRLPVASAGLGEALAHFGIESASSARHTALGDATLTAHLLNKLFDVIGLPAPETSEAG
ncbi:MAG: 3'-5' exonuclease [Nitrospirae bacterium]|nr:3'-5' exonuclease [Nitrospirota bacterium]